MNDPLQYTPEEFTDRFRTTSRNTLNLMSVFIEELVVAETRFKDCASFYPEYSFKNLYEVTSDMMYHTQRLFNKEEEEKEGEEKETKIEGFSCNNMGEFRVMMKGLLYEVVMECFDIAIEAVNAEEKK
jgi:hypothetical protein